MSLIRALLSLSLVIILIAAVLQEHVFIETKPPAYTSFVTLCEDPPIACYYPQKQFFSFHYGRLPNHQHIFAAHYRYVSGYPVVRANNPERGYFFSALQYASEQETVRVFYPIWEIGSAVTVSAKARAEILYYGWSFSEISAFINNHWARILSSLRRYLKEAASHNQDIWSFGSGQYLSSVASGIGAFVSYEPQEERRNGEYEREKCNRIVDGLLIKCYEPLPEGFALVLLLVVSVVGCLTESVMWWLERRRIRKRGWQFVAGNRRQWFRPLRRIRRDAKKHTLQNEKR
jgi:hypothetical protein